jgi:hypothetical protein
VSRNREFFAPLTTLFTRPLFLAYKIGSCTN